LLQSSILSPFIIVFYQIKLRSYTFRPQCCHIVYSTRTNLTLYGNKITVSIQMNIGISQYIVFGKNKGYFFFLSLYRAFWYL